MRTTAQIVQTSIGPRVRVDCRDGLCDWPILYRDGRIAYDRPTWIPKFIKPKVRRLLLVLAGTGEG
jgi:hypothetical protein